MRISALYIILINKNFWIPAFAGMTSLGHSRTDCFAGMTALDSSFFSRMTIVTNQRGKKAEYIDDKITTSIFLDGDSLNFLQSCYTTFNFVQSFFP